jgi:hypothetical protein
MRPFVTTAAVAAVFAISGCATSPADLEKAGEHRSMTAAAAPDRLAPCLVYHLERDNPGAYGGWFIGLGADVKHWIRDGRAEVFARVPNGLAHYAVNMAAGPDGGSAVDIYAQDAALMRATHTLDLLAEEIALCDSQLASTVPPSPAWGEPEGRVTRSQNGRP